MKNSIRIDVDTDMVPMVRIGKLTEDEPVDSEGIKQMVFNDITCVTEALLTLISLADSNGYSKRENLTEAIIKRLQESLK